MEDFEIIKCITKNSPGSVYVVKSKTDHQIYALKKIECHDESDAIKAFYEEMDLKTLDHPYICAYKDFFVTFEKDQSSMFMNIISQYFEKGNLAQIIQEYYDKKEPIPEQVIKKIMGEILEGLVFIHEKGVIHRNIRPSSIYVKDNGAMVLGGLGVSTIMGDAFNNTRATLKRKVFMAPEITSQAHDQRSDLFSLGALLLHLLTATVHKPSEFERKLKEIKECPEILNEELETVSQTYSKSMVSLTQVLMRPKHGTRPDTLELTKMGFIQECMAQVDSSQLDKRARQKETGSTKQYSLAEGRDDAVKVLEYIADTIDHEQCVAEGLTALSEIVRDNDKAYELIDQKARNLISLAMWDNVFNKDVQIAGCYVLSNLVVFAEPDDILFGPDVITIIHRIMTTHEYESDVQLAAVNLILALSADEKASRIIVQLGGIVDILIAMRHFPGHASLCAVSCMALWSLTVDEENLKVAGKNNAVRDVCKALNTHKVAPEVCEAAAAALVSLLLDDGCYEPFNELDCTGNLVAAISLHPKNAKVVKNCCKVLATVVEANEECAYRFLTSDNPEDDRPTGIPTIMEAYHLHKDNAMVVESIVRLLLELSNYDDINAEMQAALIGPQLLSEVHKRYKENRDIMGPVEEALDRLGAGVVSRGQRASS